MAMTFSLILRTDCILTMMYELYSFTFDNYIWQMVAALFYLCWLVFVGCQFDRGEEQKPNPG